MAKSVVMFNLALPPDIYEWVKKTAEECNTSATKIIIAFIAEGLAKRQIEKEGE